MSITAAAALPHPPLIIPAVGRGEEKGIAATVENYKKAAAFLGAQKPATVVLLSPHSILYQDYFHISPGPGAKGSFARFGAPGVKIEVEYDRDFAASLAAAAEAADIPAGGEGERDPALDHATMIPLYFLNQYYTGYKTVRIGLSGLTAATHAAFGRCIAEVAKEKNAVLIASGDLSHRLKDDGPYGFRSEGPKLDKAITEALAAADFEALFAIDDSLAEAGAECGLRAFWVMAGALSLWPAVEADLLSYEGPFGVGYAVATFAPEKAR